MNKQKMIGNKGESRTGVDSERGTTLSPAQEVREIARNRKLHPDFEAMEEYGRTSPVAKALRALAEIEKDGTRKRGAKALPLSK